MWLPVFNVEAGYLDVHVPYSASIWPLGGAIDLHLCYSIKVADDFGGINELCLSFYYVNIHWAKKVHRLTIFCTYM